MFRATHPNHLQRPTFRPALERLEEREMLDSGFLDSTFGVNGSLTLPLNSPRISVQSDGKILAMGGSREPGETDKGVILRYLPTGGLDASFGQNGRLLTDRIARARTVLPDGKAVVIDASATVTRYNPDGRLDRSFGTDGRVTIPFQTLNSADLYVLADGKLIVTGNCNDGVMARLDASGRLDTSFGNGGTIGSCLVSLPSQDIMLTTFRPLPDGSALAFASLFVYEPLIVCKPDPRTGVRCPPPPRRDSIPHVSNFTKYTSTGRPDAGFGVVDISRLGRGESIGLQPDGKILVTASLGKLVCFNGDGSRDQSFGMNGEVDTQFVVFGFAGSNMVLRPDGTIVLYRSELRDSFLRLLPNGKIDFSFGTAGQMTVRRPGSSAGSIGPITVQPDGNLLLLAFNNLPALHRFVFVSSAVSANEAYVTQLYRNLLQREPDPVGFRHFVGLLDRGAATRIQVGMAISTSTEYYGVVVKDLYRTLLLREADPSGLAGYVNALAAGGTVAMVKASLLASDEFFRGAAFQNTSWLVTAYLRLLFRGPDDTGRQVFGAALTAESSRHTVALILATSVEAAQITVRGYYRQFLRREPDRAGLDGFVAILQAGAGVPAPLPSGQPGAVSVSLRVQRREGEIPVIMLASAEFLAGF